MVNIGIPLWIGTFTNQSVEEINRILLENKIELIELSIDYPWPQKQVELLRNAITCFANNFKISIHAPWRDLPLATPYENIRKTVVKELLNIINSIY
ncbi:MAG: sugar phosphate isomerase/epimerase, partial [Staphylothermus sp.]|nr:sugar phosphate isomerase/epimerase [Staphylothermus sp.]